MTKHKFLATLTADQLATVTGGGDWTLPAPSSGTGKLASPRDPASLVGAVGPESPIDPAILGGIIGPIDGK